MHYKLWINFGRSGYAVGLSAISFSAALQKDAAPIPNAEGLQQKKGLLSKPLVFGDPPEARTQDPHIKSVMLYLLS